MCPYCKYKTIKDHNINITPGFYHHIRQFHKKNQGLKFVGYKHIETRGRPSKFNDEKIRMHLYQHVRSHSEMGVQNTHYLCDSIKSGVCSQCQCQAKKGKNLLTIFE